ncbi:unnamed protein product [Ectocarpus sp. 6 AP-2014]
MNGVNPPSEILSYLQNEEVTQRKIYIYVEREREGKAAGRSHA